jgi:hypothetical protein
MLIPCFFDLFGYNQNMETKTIDITNITLAPITGAVSDKQANYATSRRAEALATLANDMLPGVEQGKATMDQIYETLASVAEQIGTDAKVWLDDVAGSLHCYFRAEPSRKVIWTNALTNAGIGR